MRKLLLSLFALLTAGGAAWADGLDVTGKTFTLTAQGGRGTVYGNGTVLNYQGTAEQAGNFAIIEYDGEHYLYDADNKKFIVHELPASQVNAGNNTCLESSTDFSMIVKGVTFIPASSDTYDGANYEGKFLLEDSNGFHLGVGGSGVVFNTWSWYDDGNYFTVDVAETDFSDADARAMLDEWFSVTVAYNIVDTKGQTVFTSEKIRAEIGDEITELPNEYKRAFCTYEVESTTIQRGDNVVNVTVTYNMPFEISEDYASATWYTMNIRGTKDVSMGSTEPYALAAATLETKLLNDEYHWAFIGNPYEFAVINKAAGEGSTLTKAGDNAVMRNGDYRWTLCQNNDGFTLKETGTATNYVNDNNSTLKFWNAAAASTDNGSTFRVTAVPADVYTALLEKQIEEANATLQTIGNVGTPGHLTAEAKAAFEAAIQEAEAATSDYQTAYNNLKAAIATAKASVSYVPRTDVYYTITSSRGSMVYDPSHDDATDTTNGGANYLWYTTSELDGTDSNTLWGFVEKDGLYYMYNVAKEQFATVGKGSYGPTWIFSDTPAYITLDDGMGNEVVAPKVRIQATIATTRQSYAMSISTNYTGPVITYDAVGDGGIPMQFIERGAADPELIKEIMRKIENPEPYREALKALIASVASVTTGDGLGEYSASSDYASVLEAANAAVASTDATIESLTAAREALEAAIATLTLNLPQAGTFLRLTGMSGNAISEGIANNDNKTFTMSDADDATTIFYFDGQHLINLSTGKANAMSSSQWAWVYGTDNASVVTFREGDERGKYYVGSGGQDFHDKNEMTCVRKGAAGARTDGTSFNWTLTEITKLPITVSSLGFATLWSPVALEIPEGVTAYTGVISDNKKYLKLTAVEGTTLPALTAVVLKAEPTEYTFSVSENSMEAIASDLTGGLGATVTASSILTLQQPAVATEPGFYTYTGTGAAGFKAYLNGADAAEIKGFIFGDDATGIAGIENGNTAEGTALYNLAGQRVAKTVKGIYVVGGKKVLVK